VFERSELFEALAELTERSEKKNSDCASEVGGRSPSRSKQERIINLKWAQPSLGERKTKRVVGGERGSGGNRSIVKLYSCFFARARFLTL
jgi:hypothetical protein